MLRNSWPLFAPEEEEHERAKDKAKLLLELEKVKNSRPVGWNGVHGNVTIRALYGFC